MFFLNEQSIIRRSFLHVGEVIRTEIRIQLADTAYHHLIFIDYYNTCTAYFFHIKALE